MRRAGWCDVDNAWVWVADDGSCVNGHGPEHVSRIYDTENQQAPPPQPPVSNYPPTPPVPPGSPAPGYGPGYGQGYGQPVYGGGSGGSGSNAAMVSLILGIVSIVGCFPLLTIPAAIAGLVFGIRGLRTEKRTLAIVGIVLSSIGLVIGVVNAFLGAMLAVMDPSIWQELGVEPPTPR